LISAHQNDLKTKKISKKYSKYEETRFALHSLTSTKYCTPSPPSGGMSTAGCAESDTTSLVGYAF